MTSRTDALDAATEVPPAARAVGAAATRGRRRALDFVALTKPRVVLMVAVTTLVGYHVAAGADYRRLLHTLLGTALAAAGTLALNQFLERDLDARMARTRGRPLPGGRLAPGEALGFGTLLLLAGVLYQAATVGLAAAALTGATAVLYLFAYTPLKRVSPLCMVVGAVPGALPPVTGWVAARGDLDVGAWILFAILFLWQLPHTLAIAWLYRDDYARAGIRVLPAVDVHGASTQRQIVAGCLALHAVALLPTLVGLAGPVYFFGALVLGAAFLSCGLAQALAPSAAAARRLVLASILHLPLLLGLMALDRVAG
jgi:protoheme IX farnesyltransferase